MGWLQVEQRAVVIKSQRKTSKLHCRYNDIKNTFFVLIARKTIRIRSRVTLCSVVS